MSVGQKVVFPLNLNKKNHGIVSVTHKTTEVLNEMRNIYILARLTSQGNALVNLVHYFE